MQLGLNQCIMIILGIFLIAEEFLREVKGMFVYSICNLWL